MAQDFGDPVHDHRCCCETGETEPDWIDPLADVEADDVR
jgi:hypothetical protein